MANDVEAIVAEKVTQEVITIEEIKEVLEIISAYTTAVDLILANFEARISALES